VNAAGQVNGHVSLDIKSEPQFASASRACRIDLRSGSSTPTKQVSIQAPLAYANCMRSHGIINFPDPMPGGGFNIAFNTNTPQFQAADSACGERFPE
jgi:hypothetical protein